MHIRQTLSQSRLTWRLGALLALTLAALILAPAVALAQTPPAAPPAVTVTHNGGTVDASWDAVSGATKYHVTYSFNNKTSWVAASCADNCTSNSYTVTAADPAKTYIVAVRAGNADGWSSWVNSAPAAPSNPPPAAPSTVTVTRADGTLTVTGYAVSNATKYHITYSSNNKQSWSGPPCADNCAGTSITITGVDNGKTYIVGVRARNAAGESAWVNSAAAPPPPCEVSNLRTVTRTVHGQAGGRITATWDTGKRASAYNVNHRRDGGEWERIKSNHSATSHTWSVTQSGNYLVAVQSVKDGGLSEWQNADVAWLTADGIAGTAAALTIAGHSGDWWYKATAAPDNTCKGPVSATIKGLTGLTANNSYTYTAYDDSGCANAIASTTFTPSAGISVSNLSEVSDGAGRTVLLSDLEANAFTTGDHSSGYTLHRVVIKFRTSINPGGVLTAAIHTESGGDPADSATYTLSGNGDPATAGDYTYTCSGTCSLDKDTTYFLVLSGTSLTHSLGYHLVDTTDSDIETNAPSDAGWEIADTAKYTSGNTWTDEATPASIMFEVFAAAKP